MRPHSKSGNLFPSALLSATLAGGIFAYSAAIVAENKTDQTESAAAQTTQNEQASTDKAPTLTQLDQNNDRGLVWSEIEAIYDSELEQAGWTEEFVLSEYDKDGDDLLNEEEYTTFVSGIVAETVDQADPPSSELDTTAGMEARDNELADTVNTQAQQMRFNEMSAAKGEDSNAMERATQGESAKGENGSGVKTVAVTDLSVEEIEDREVVSSAGDNLGQVEKVLTAPDGSISGLVVGVGGFWDVGNKDIFVPVDQVKRSGEEIIWETDLTEEDLEDIPLHKTQSISTLHNED